MIDSDCTLDTLSSVIYEWTESHLGNWQQTKATINLYKRTCEIKQRSSSSASTIIDQCWLNYTQCYNISVNV